MDSRFAWFLAVDIETLTDPAAELPLPVANRSLKDPEKIAADVRAKLESQRDKCALDPWASRPIVISSQTEAEAAPRIEVLPDDRALLDALVELGARIAPSGEARREIVGFRVRTFDWPHLRFHAYRLGVTLPAVDARKYGNVHLTDLYDVLCDDECEHVMSRSLKSTCRVFGVVVPEDDCDGRDVATLFAAGDVAAISRHCALDVARTLGLARRVGMIP